MPKKRVKRRTRKPKQVKVAATYTPSNRKGIWHLYVLKLKGGYWYVGITARSEIHWRYRQHIRGAGAAWTRLHPPTSVYETYQLGKMSEKDAVELETTKTLTLMKKHGVDAVRGGLLIYTNMEVNRAMHKKLVKA